MRVRNDDASFERAVVAWANRPNNCLELEYGNALKYGAVGNDLHTLGWGNDVPEIGRWHVLAYVYQGGKDGDLQAWCDGELRSSKNPSLRKSSPPSNAIRQRTGAYTVNHHRKQLAS